jgi:hypothetical protein
MSFSPTCNDNPRGVEVDVLTPHRVCGLAVQERRGKDGL